VLSIADREGGDGDGTLTEADADADLAVWGDGLVTDLPVEVDGEPVVVQWGEPYLDPTGAIAPRPATVEMVARIPLAAGEHRITMRDRMQRETYDRTDVAFRVRESAELVASGAEEDPEGRAVTLAFAGSRGPDVFTAVVNVAGPSEEAAPEDEEGAPPWLWLGVLSVAVILALGFYATRRRLG
jgi:hypothetical protein